MSLTKWIPQCTVSLDALWSTSVSTQQCPAPLWLHKHCRAAEFIGYTVCHMDPITGTWIQQETGDPLCAQYTQLLFLASIWPVTLPHRSTTAGLAATKPPHLTPPTKSMHEQAEGEDAASALIHPMRRILSKFQKQNPASVQWEVGYPFPLLLLPRKINKLFLGQCFNGRRLWKTLSLFIYVWLIN